MPFTLKGIIANLANKAGGGILEGAKGILQTFIADPTERAKAEAELAKLEITHQETMRSLDIEEEKNRLADMDSARQMQIAALNQSDTFTKRYIYYLASLVIGFVFVYDVCMFFVKYPQENRDMINMVAGVLNSTALVMVLSFFFGSSKSSHDKDDTINSLIK